VLKAEGFFTRLRRAGLPAGRQGLKPACREARIPSTVVIADYC